MPRIKDILKAPLALPRSIETSLPKGAPQVSAMLSSIVDSLPAVPALPAAVSRMPKVAGVTEFIKSIEAGLPVGLPKLGGQSAAGETPPPAPRKAPELVFE